MAGPSAASTNGVARISQLDAELEGTSVFGEITETDRRSATAFFCAFTTSRDESMTADVTRSARFVQAIMTRGARGRAVYQKGFCLRRTVVADHRGRRKVVENRGTRAHYRKCRVAPLSRNVLRIVEIAGISQSTARPHLAAFILPQSGRWSALRGGWPADNLNLRIDGFKPI